MAIFVRSGTAGGSGIQLDPLYNGYLLTSESREVSTTEDVIRGFGSNHVVTILGFVGGALSCIVLGNDATLDSGETVRIGTSGSVYAGTDGVDGIRINARDSSVRNDGLIFGRDDGIEMNAGAGTGRIVNTGTIMSEDEGIRGSGLQTLIIENSGLIYGELRSIATFGGATAQITNTGEIVGEIYLDSGNDVYMGVNGRVSGPITCFGGNDTVYAGVDNDTIRGMSGNDIINGGRGADRMVGGADNDTYYVDNVGDVIVEVAGEGTDIVATAVSYRLAAGASVERMNTTSQGATSAINLTGNEFAQTLIGNAGDNRLEGREGNDTLRGLAGKDTFVFNTKLGASNVDTITDFSVADDRFLLSDAIFTQLNTGVLAGGYFRANTTGLAQDSNDHIIYETDTGELYYDSNGSGAGGSVLFAKIAVGLSLTNADFSVA
jgi:Ca2+-binding RTX toxin-like protein